ncbi:MAG TPA: STAS/SEC14 domain-containing protein, partial [Stellaceae bacterium]
ERVAIVTDIAWVSLTVKALRFLIPGEIRVFSTVQTAEGRAWITARPGSRADTDAAAFVGARPSGGRSAKPLPRRPRLAAAARPQPVEERHPGYAE